MEQIKKLCPHCRSETAEIKDGKCTSCGQPIKKPFINIFFDEGDINYFGGGPTY